MSTASEILGRIEDDPVFRGFLETGFDPAAFASKIVKADVGKSAQQASSHTPVLQQAGGGNGALFSSVSGTIGVERVGAPLASAESVSSQAEITLDVSEIRALRLWSAARSKHENGRCSTFVLRCFGRVFCLDSEGELAADATC